MPKDTEKYGKKQFAGTKQSSDISGQASKLMSELKALEAQAAAKRAELQAAGASYNAAREAWASENPVGTPENPIMLPRTVVQGQPNVVTQQELYDIQRSGIPAQERQLERPGVRFPSEAPLAVPAGQPAARIPSRELRPLQPTAPTPEGMARAVPQPVQPVVDQKTVMRLMGFDEPEEEVMP